MLIYQDFEEATDKGSFILNAINEFKGSKFYLRALDAQSYYKGANTTILDRKFEFYTKGGHLQEDIFKANNKVCSEFFPKIAKQIVSYLLANGVTVSDEAIQNDLGRWFNVKMQELGTYATVDGVGYGYGFINSQGKFQMDVWRGTEAIPLFDERTGLIMAIIRFWQIDAERPLFAELYTIDGKVEYKFIDNKIEVLTELSSYKKNVVKDILGSSISEAGNFSVLPVFPLYFNDIKESSFNMALKSKIDLYDIISSDFGNNLEDVQDVYWCLTNYQGQDIGEFLENYKKYKAITLDEDGGAEAKTIDVPYQAREIALDILKKQIYSDSMALDTSVLSGGSLTNIAIKANMMDLDLKADGFENQVYSFLYNVIGLLLEIKGTPNTEYDIELIRRSLINDTEAIDNIYKMRSDISHETALKLNPYIKDEKKEMELIDEEGLSKYDTKSIIEEKIIEEE